jgi:hypothetical protein
MEPHVDSGNRQKLRISDTKEQDERRVAVLAKSISSKGHKPSLIVISIVSSSLPTQASAQSMPRNVT